MCSETTNRERLLGRLAEGLVGANDGGRVAAHASELVDALIGSLIDEDTTILVELVEKLATSLIATGHSVTSVGLSLDILEAVTRRMLFADALDCAGLARRSEQLADTVEAGRKRLVKLELARIGRARRLEAAELA